MQLTLDLAIPKEKAAGHTNYRHPLKDFLDLAITSGAIQEEDDMGVLREACRISGLNMAGWRFLNRHGKSAYAAVLSAEEDGESVFEKAMFYVNWQCHGGLKHPLDIELGTRFITYMKGTYELIPDVDPRILKVADDYCNDLADPAERLLFAQDEWVRVLDWLRNQQPVFDRNQWRSGWRAIHRNYQKWQRLNPELNAWHSLVPAFEEDDLHIRPLTSTYDLAREAFQMQNCIEDYAKPCLSGNYRLFSIAEKSTGTSLAVAGIEKEGDYWKIDQIKGRFNQDPETRAAKLGLVITKRYMHQEELIARRNTLEHQQCIEQLRAEHEAFLNKRQIISKEFKAEFSLDEISYLESHGVWLGALASGELQPNACEQVRFIAVSKGILAPGTKPEKIWKRFQRLCNSSKNHMAIRIE